MKIDSEVRLTELSVDDELVINGAVDQPGQWLVTLGSGQTGRCTTFSGGLSICNGAHEETAGGGGCNTNGRLLATVAKGSSFTAYGRDNHGINLYLDLKVVVLPVEAP